MISPMCFFRFVILTMLVVAVGNVSAQTETDLVVSSPNSRLVAVAHYTGKTTDTVVVLKRGASKVKKMKVHNTVINIYVAPTREWIQSFTIKTLEENTIVSMGFSPNNMLFYVYDGQRNRVWNLHNGKEVNKSWGGVVAFPNAKNHYFVIFDSYINICNAFSGELDSVMRVSVGNNIRQAYCTDDDKILVVQTDKHFTTIELRVKGKKKRFVGDQMKISTEDSTIVLLNNTGKSLSVSSFRLPDYSRIKAFSINSFLKTEEQNENKKAFGRNVSPKGVEPLKMIDGSAMLSPDGRFASFVAERGTQARRMYIVDTRTNNVKMIQSNIANYDCQMYPYQWIESSVVAINVNDLLHFPYSLNTAEFLQPVSFYFDFNKTQKSVPYLKQLVEGHRSPDMRYFVLPYLNSLLLRPTTIVQSRSVASGINFKAFSNNSKYVFGYNTQGTFGYVTTSDVAADTSGILTFYTMSDSLLNRFSESEVQDDHTPVGYSYQRINQFKHISEAGDSAWVRLHLKTVEMHDTAAAIQVHLIDDNGVYYYGAGAPEWRYIWRHLLVKSQYGETRNVKNFRIVENYTTDKIPAAIALVLDHSGSMGEQRALALQKAMRNFVDKKNPNDAMTVIKYDGRTAIETPFTTNKDKIIKKIDVDGLKGFGGSTSLLDGIDLATSVLSSTDLYKRKAIVIFTDGHENSSLVSKGQMLRNANKFGVNVFTVGFGDFVSQDYLNAIAMYTAGSYYQIYDTKWFDWVFTDIYNKMQCYYSIEFDTDTLDQYTAYLEIGINDARRDSMFTGFDNRPVDYQQLDQQSNAAPFVQPVITYTAKDTAFIHDFITVIDSVKQAEALIADSVQHEFYAIEFPNVQFDFDQITMVAHTDVGIEQVATFMKKYPHARIEIRGHTDNAGSDQHNMELSLQRADMVRQLLIQRGVNKNRISTRGFGDKQPLGNNDTDTGRALNRRVEFVLLSD